MVCGCVCVCVDAVACESSISAREVWLTVSIKLMAFCDFTAPNFKCIEHFVDVLVCEYVVAFCGCVLIFVMFATRKSMISYPTTEFLLKPSLCI